MSWNSFKDLADQVVDKKGIKNQIQESLVLETANKILIDFLSEQTKDKLSAVYFRNGILTIAALDDNLLKQLLNDKDLFITSLNSKLGDNIIEDLNFLS
ncbi:MAG: DUF721 domain-containing protein [Candidatus Komeilibacteria bacterium]|jgi:hypothetical protein|nr:DUF721 domain-containing protein [Candidatus Komeilibacteria bacterium]MBT4447260.1 DUF721 domain-containing protein [Candidatus Komeilibacteria bacterium]